jgi:hypothetical protein
VRRASLPRTRVLALSAIPAIAAAAIAGTAGGATTHAARTETTTLLSRSFSGGTPNGPSSHGVISDDKRYARVIAFQSDASNIVRGDTDGTTDVFAIRRAGPVGNNGTTWRPGHTSMISRTFNGKPPNGASFSPAVSGAFHSTPTCVAFLSSASNLVRRDTNGKVDAFVSRGPGRKPQRLLLPHNRQPKADVSSVAVSGDCSRIAFASGGHVYVHTGSRTKALHSSPGAADPSFSTGLRDDLVFSASRGVYFSRNGTSRPKLIARHGTNPAYNDIKRQVVTYNRGSSVIYKDLHGGTRTISRGLTDARNPVIGNSGFYVTFQAAQGIFLYTDVRRLVTNQAVGPDGRDLDGAANPSMSFYANYILFDAGRDGSSRQVYLRYLGGI